MAAPRHARKAAGLKKVGTKINSSARKAVDKLNPNKRAFVLARAKGKTVKAASEEAGISRRYGTKLQTEAEVQAAYRELIRAAIPAKSIVKAIKGGMEATRTLFHEDKSGKMKTKEVPDWKTRRPYVEMAADHGGYHEIKKDSGGVIIAVQAQLTAKTITVG
jgi:hypothetical protein